MKQSTLCILAALPLLTVSTYGNLIVTVDIINNTLSMSGSISGTLEGTPGSFQYRGSLSGSQVGQEDFSLNSGISGNPFTSFTANLFIDDFTITDNVNFFFFHGSSIDGEAQVLTGNGSPIAYSLSSAYETILEDLAIANATIPLTLGTTTDTLTLVAVPEPAGFASILAISYVGAALLRRRKRSS